MGGCQNYGPFLGTLNIRCRIIIGIQKGTIILTTTLMLDEGGGFKVSSAQTCLPKESQTRTAWRKESQEPPGKTPSNGYFSTSDFSNTPETS